jgi:hypothetical protein
MAAACEKINRPIEIMMSAARIPWPSFGTASARFCPDSQAAFRPWLPGLRNRSGLYRCDASTGSSR